mgnify:CR=1 FL=1
MRCQAEAGYVPQQVCGREVTQVHRPEFRWHLLSMKQIVGTTYCTKVFECERESLVVRQNI